MKTIDKNKLDEAIECYKNFCYLDGEEKEYFETAYNLTNEIEKEVFGGLVYGVFDLFKGAYRMKRDIANEEIYKLYEMLGFEVK